MSARVSTLRGRGFSVVVTLCEPESDLRCTGDLWLEAGCHL